MKRAPDGRAGHADLRMCCGVVGGLFGKRDDRLRRRRLTWVNFSSGAAYTAKASELCDLTGCCTDASTTDELVLQIIAVRPGVRTNNRNAPSVFSQTYEALLCTRGVTMDDALDRICTIASEINTSGNTRAAMALVAIESSSLPPPRTGEQPEFCVTCFSVGHGAGVCPAKPEYSVKCCCLCRDSGHSVSDYTHLSSSDGRLRRSLGDQVPTRLYPPREPRKRRSPADGSRGAQRVTAR